MLRNLFRSISNSTPNDEDSLMTESRESFLESTQYKIGETIYPFGEDAQKPIGFNIFDIKSGGMGIVYLAKLIDNYFETGSKCAIKTFQDWCFFEPEIVERFLREAEVWIKLGKHKNIVAAMGVHTVGERPFIVLEYIDGSDLRQLLKFKSLTAEHASQLARQFLQGMIHAQEVFPEFVHRDIKPENCLIDTDGVLKVTDFGLAKIFQTEIAANLSTRLTGSISVFRTQAGEAGTGTLPYMAPEQFEDFSKTDSRTDVYSFGVMFYEMLVGRRPFSAVEFDEWYYHHKNTKPIPPHLVRESVPELLSFIAMQCLEKNPNDRLPDFRSIWLMIAAGSGARIEVKPGAPPATEVERPNSLANKAFSLHQLGKHEEALSLINRAIQGSSSDWLFWGIKGGILAALEEHEDAIRCFDKENELNPGHKEPTLNKAKLFRKLDRHKDALASIEELLNIFPVDARLYVEKAITLYDLDLDEFAKVSIDKAISIDSKDAVVLFQKALDLQNERKFHESIGFIDDALKYGRDDDEDWLDLLGNAWGLKGTSLVSLGRVREGYTCLERSVSANPNNSASLYLIGILHLREDLGIESDFDKGITFLQRAADLGQPAAKEWLGKILG